MRKTSLTKTKRFLIGATCAAVVAFSGLGFKPLKGSIQTLPIAYANQLQKKNQTVDGLMTSLKSKDWLSRSEAARELGNMARKKKNIQLPKALHVLIEKLQLGKQPYDYTYALEYISRAYPKHPDLIKAVPNLIKLGNHKDVDIRSAVVSALGYAGDIRAVPVLVKLLKDKDRSVGLAAIASLSQIGTGRYWEPEFLRAVPALIDTIDDKDPALRSVAADLIWDVANANWKFAGNLYFPYGSSGCIYTPPIDMVREVKHQIYLEKLKEDAEAICFKEKRQKTSLQIMQSVSKLIQTGILAWIHLSKDAIKAFKKGGEKHLVSSLIKLVESDGDSNLRAGAAHALGELKATKAVSILTNVLRIPNKHIQQRAAHALGRIGEKSTVSDLLGILTNRSMRHELRGEIVWALGELKDPRAVPVLIGEVETKGRKYYNVILEAIEALEKSGDKKALPALTRATQTFSDKQIKDAAKKALMEISKR